MAHKIINVEQMLGDVETRRGRPYMTHSFYKEVACCFTHDARHVACMLYNQLGLFRVSDLQLERHISLPTSGAITMQFIGREDPTLVISYSENLGQPNEKSLAYTVSGLLSAENGTIAPLLSLSNPDVTMRPSNSTIHCMDSSFRRDILVCASTGSSDHVYIVDFNKNSFGQCAVKMQRHAMMCSNVSLNGDGSLLAVCNSDVAIYKVGISSNEGLLIVTRIKPEENSSFWGCGLSTNGLFAIMGENDKCRLSLWDVSTGTQLNTLQPGKGRTWLQWFSFVDDSGAILVASSTQLTFWPSSSENKFECVFKYNRQIDRMAYGNGGMGVVVSGKRFLFLDFFSREREKLLLIARVSKLPTVTMRLVKQFVIPSIT